MSDQGDPLARIAAALERLAPPPPTATDWTGSPASYWPEGSHTIKLTRRAFVSNGFSLSTGLDFETRAPSA